MRRTEPLLPETRGTDVLDGQPVGAGGGTAGATIETSARGDGPRVSPWAPPTEAGGAGAVERTEVLDGGRRRPGRSVELVAGQVLDGRYRLVKPIGSGGMGEVWEVAREGLETPLALKILKDSGADHIKVERFLREARAVAMLDHANIVRVTDFGHTGDGLPFFVMEHLRGFTLAELVKKDGAMAWPRARRLLLQVAEALAVAHEQGIIHRDLKPSNVFVIGEPGHERVKIIDFGIAKFSEVHEDLRTLTQTGIVQGTPAYMSPEQARGEKVDFRTDQYSLGIIAYQLLSGTSPFAAGNVRDTMYKQVFKHPEPLGVAVPGIPPSVDAVVRRLLRKDASLRFEDMAGAVAALQAMGEGAVPVEVPDERLPSMSMVATRPPVDAGAEAPAPAVVEPAAMPGRGHGMVLSLVVGIVVGVGTVMGVLLLGDGEEPVQPVESVAPADSPVAGTPSPVEPAAPPAEVSPGPGPQAEPRPEPGPEVQAGPVGEGPGHSGGPTSRKTKREKGPRPETAPDPPPADANLPPVDPALSDPFSRG